ncbi:importin-5 [Artemisia annua]|uniref:Importin-5 n=1 Tax=Artemisia annua TaxID=35608 RepID=A0A2U1N220_ARTAN|nr:importin-5 [Artemisia annua]
MDQMLLTCDSLRSLEIRRCKMFSEDGLMDIARYCIDLRSLRLEDNEIDDNANGKWLHELALRNTVMESLDFHYPFNRYDMKDVTRLANKCTNSLVSLNVFPVSVSDFRKVFKHANKLDHFGYVIIDEDWYYRYYSSFRFPPNIRGLRFQQLHEASLPFLLPYLNQLRCPSLEVLVNHDTCGDEGLQVIGQFCKKLRKLTHRGRVTQMGLIALAQGCPNLDYLEVTLLDISNEALECVGTHLKNLRDLRIWLAIEETDSWLDNGIRAMLMSCSKLEKLDIGLLGRGLTDVGLRYIGKYGHNLRSLSLCSTGESDVGLLELSKGCPKLRKLRLRFCPFSEQAVATFVFSINHSLRYIRIDDDFLMFCENCTPDILTPYLDGIVSKVLVLLQNGKQMVQEGASTASVADSSQEQIQKYYDVVMPNLKAILVNANDKANCMVRAKVIECISLVGMAVGKDIFRDDSKQVMEILMSLQGVQMATDDPTTSSMLQDFLPYMTVVMPPLLQSAQLKPNMIIISANSDNESMETITLGDKRIGIKTSVLEEKATACHTLCCYAIELKEGFFPWIDQVAPILVPFLKFYFHKEVRKAAVSAMPDLLRSSKLAIEKGLAQGRDGTHLKQLSDYIVPALVEALHKEPDTEIIAKMLDALSECLQISGPLLDENQVRSIVDEIKHVITASSSRKGGRAERTNAEDLDAEEGELLKVENEQEEEVFDQVGEVLGTLVKTFKASFLPFFDELSSYLMPMLGKDKTAEERRIAICIFDDVAEQCHEAALRYYDTYLPLVLEACNDENSDVRQAAVYGLGVCAEHGGSVIKPLIGEALTRLNAVIRHPNAHHPDNVMVYDNAVSTLGKVCHFHRDSIDSTQVIPAWLNCLPIKGDVIEAKAVHESDAELLGSNNQNLPKIVSIFAEILCAGKDLASDQTISRIINLLRQLQQKLPPAILASIWSALQPQQQLALQSILSS